MTEIKPPKPKKNIKKRLIILSATLSVLAAGLFFAFDPRLLVTRYTYTGDLPKGFDGFKIVQLSDLHCKWFGENQEKLIDKIEALSPDLVVLTGDMMDVNLVDFEPVEALVRQLTLRWPVISVWGNHDRWLDNSDFNRLKRIFDGYGVVTLQDDSILWEHGGSSIMISGTDDPPMWTNDQEYYIKNPPAVSPAEGMFNLLLHHRANLFPQLAPLGFDLVLSGHMHGGQFRIPFVMGLVSPNLEFFPPLTSGKHTRDGTVIIISRGLGNGTLPPRIFNPPEILLITLKSEVTK